MIHSVVTLMRLDFNYKLTTSRLKGLASVLNDLSGKVGFQSEQPGVVLLA
jgi:hypothetical protein